MSIPNVCHFSYYRGPTKWKWRDLHTIALITAHEFGKFEKLVVHEDVPGEGPWYEYARRLPYVEWRRTSFPYEVNGYPIKDQRISADLHRLSTLYTEGGVYADLDFVFLAPFTPLLSNQVFIGTQNKQRKKLACGLMGAVPQSDFMLEYIQQYDAWTPAEEKKWWTFANTIPWNLSERIPITVLPTQLFYPVAWSNETFFQGKPHNFTGAIAVHLWEHLRPTLTVDQLLATVIQPTIKQCLEIIDGLIAKKNMIMTFD